MFRYVNVPVLPLTRYFAVKVCGPAESPDTKYVPLACICDDPRLEIESGSLLVEVMAAPATENDINEV